MAFRRRNKSYPFFSQEFLIQNHADIVFSLVILVLIGLMFEVSSRVVVLGVFLSASQTAVSLSLFLSSDSYIEVNRAALTRPTDFTFNLNV